jgi:ABC-type Zn2+ transport system substrate-binding protein/surface adhesin
MSDNNQNISHTHAHAHARTRTHAHTHTFLIHIFIIDRIIINICSDVGEGSASFERFIYKEQYS